MERGGVHILLVGVELVCELEGFRENLLPLGLAHLAEGLFIMMNQQQVFHEAPSIDIR
jgi:hydrogenase-4 membrane subunit HyfE